MKECEHCGICCNSGIPCAFGQILFDITEKNPQSCPALAHNGNGYWCGLLLDPVGWFTPMVGNEKWKCEAMSDIAHIYIGIGDGCGSNPSQRKIIANMRKLAEVKK